MSPYLANPQPSLFDFHAAIQADQALNNAQKQFASQAVQADLGAPPLTAPLTNILPQLGGGFLGYQVGKYMDMSLPGKVITTAAGYGVGKLVSDFYQGYSKAVSNDTSWRMRPFA